MALDILPMLLASWEYRRSLAWVAEVGASVLVLFISKRVEEQGYNGAVVTVVHVTPNSHMANRCPRSPTNVSLI
jgi:hypothetical protein